MTVGIVGLGLIGGSFAKAYQAAGHTVLGCDTDRSTLAFASLSGAIHGELTPENVSGCDLVLVCVCPHAAVAWMTDMADRFGPGPLVVDCCGTKRAVWKAGVALAREHGFSYIGGHPMAGRQYSGFKYSSADLFRGATMVIVPPGFDDIALLGRAKELLAPAGFGRMSVMTAEEHDEAIAFTSQLAHVVSNAYIKSPTAGKHRGASAGSYRDMTRVAWLNPQMWAELFLENGEYLDRELDWLIASLQEYRDAIAAGDRERLERLLEDGRQRKGEVDGR